LPNKVPTAPPIFSLPTAAANPLPKLVAGWYGSEKPTSTEIFMLLATPSKPHKNNAHAIYSQDANLKSTPRKSQYLSDPLSKRKPRCKANICMQLSSPFHSTGSVTHFWNRMDDQRGCAGGLMDAARLIRFHGCPFLPIIISLDDDDDDDELGVCASLFFILWLYGRERKRERNRKRKRKRKGGLNGVLSTYLEHFRYAFGGEDVTSPSGFIEAFQLD